MTTEERDREVAWALKAAEEEDKYGGLDHPGGRVVFLAKKFPLPDTSGMTPGQAEATMAKWRAEIMAFTDAADRAPLASPVGATATAPSAPPEVPAS